MTCLPLLNQHPFGIEREPTCQRNSGTPSRCDLTHHLVHGLEVAQPPRPFDPAIVATLATG